MKENIQELEDYTKLTNRTFDSDYEMLRKLLKIDGIQISKGLPLLELSKEARKFYSEDIIPCYRSIKKPDIYYHQDFYGFVFDNKYYSNLINNFGEFIFSDINCILFKSKNDADRIIAEINKMPELLEKLYKELLAEVHKKYAKYPIFYINSDNTYINTCRFCIEICFKCLVDGKNFKTIEFDLRDWTPSTTCDDIFK